MESLGIDPKLLIAQAVNFAIFFILFSRFIAKPFMQFLHKERKLEEERQDLSNTLKKKEEEYVTKEKKMRQEMKKELDSVLQQARIDAEQIKKEMIQQAQSEADIIIDRARKQIEEEKASLYKDVKNQSADLSILLINKALKNYLNEETQKKLTQYILSNATKEAH